MKKGFTLIELLVVIAIIGILASIIIVGVNPQRNKAKDATIKSNLNTTRSSAEMYYDATSTYAGVCTSPTFNRVKNAITGQGGSWVCGNTAAAWCAASKLATNASSSWCVDSNSYSGPLSTNCLGATSVKCID